LFGLTRNARYVYRVHPVAVGDVSVHRPGLPRAERVWRSVRWPIPAAYPQFTSGKLPQAVPEVYIEGYH
jgi:hypothetical protein